MYLNRTETAQALRKSPYMVNSLVAGYDADEGVSLYWLDYLGTLQRVTRGAQGYFTISFIAERIYEILDMRDIFYLGFLIIFTIQLNYIMKK